MKGRVLFVLLLHVALASTLSGCRTADVVGGQAAHRAALQALSSRSCKIILEEVYTPSDRPEKLRAQQVTGSYLIIKGDKMLAYLTREDNSPKLFFGSSPLNDGEAALQMGVPETQKNGDVNITLRVQGNAHYRTFEWNMTPLSRLQPMFRAGEQGLHGREFQFQRAYPAFVRKVNRTFP